MTGCFMALSLQAGEGFQADAATGAWKKDRGGWWYSYSDGSFAKKCWVKDNGKWYYFNADGYMVTGWKKISGEWYYFNKKGTMVTGWKKIGGKWYYFNKNGTMVNGWKSISGKMYYFANGAMTTGWLKTGNKKYYFDESGQALSGWQTIGGKKYYFDEEMSAVTGNQTIYGESYSFDSDGVLIDEPLKVAKVGDVITFGHYEQDNLDYNGDEPIEWIVLDKNSSGELLVISKYALVNMDYSREPSAETWESCTLRSWLNGEFMYNAFDNNEKSKICTKTVVNEKNAAHGTDGGKNTKDKVFILSSSEVKKYFTGVNSGAAACKTTEYSISRENAWTYEWSIGEDTQRKKYNGNCLWWLRTPGISNELASYVNYNGQVVDLGRSVTSKKCGVRPVMWIKP